MPAPAVEQAPPSSCIVIPLIVRTMQLTYETSLRRGQYVKTETPSR